MPYKLTFSKHHSYLPFLPSLSFLREFSERPTQKCCEKKNTFSFHPKQQVISSHMHIHSFSPTFPYLQPNFLFFGVLCLSLFLLFTYLLTPLLLHFAKRCKQLWNSENNNSLYFISNQPPLLKHSKRTLAFSATVKWLGEKQMCVACISYRMQNRKLDFLWVSRRHITLYVPK